MNQASIDLANLELITFDCYGTLIDWESGIREALQEQLQQSGREWQDRYFDLYVEIEAKEECGSYRPYREILTAVELEVLSRAGLDSVSKPRLAASLAQWEPFEDTVGALHQLKDKYKLGVLSNIDRDLFRKTNKRLQVDFDVVVTAQDVESYKPGPAHFEEMLSVTGLSKKQVLHAAQSLYHDIAPCNDLDIPCVWINRPGDKLKGSAKPLAEFPSMASLADALL